MARQFKLSKLERKAGLLLKHINVDYTFGEDLAQYVHEQRRYGHLCKRYKAIYRRRE